MIAGEYLAQLQALLPSGAAWTREPDAQLTKLLTAWAQEFERIDGRIAQLIEEADPRTTFELLADWERVSALPDSCLSGDLTTEQRREALVERRTRIGGATAAFYIDVAGEIGVPITISEFVPYDVTDDVEALLYGDDWAYTWQVNAATDILQGEFSVEGSVDDILSWGGNTQLECLLGKLKPAHTTVIFSYS